MKYLALALGVSLMTGSALAQTQGTTSSKDSNAAVQTQDPSSAVGPAKGSNSFTEGQAKSRIEDHGYTNVTGLAKDGDGVWRGRAQKGGNQVGVWVDYKGAVGQGT